MKTYEDGGVRIGNETDIVIPADQNVRCPSDKILLEILAWEPSKILEVVYKGKPLRGRVIAVGPGRNVIKYDGPKGKRSKMWWGKVFIPTTVKIGDIVELGGLEQRGYLFSSYIRFRWGDKDCMVVREGDVAMVTEAEAA